MAAAATAQAAAAPAAGAGGKKKRSLWKRLTKKSKGGGNKPQDEPSEGSGSSSSGRGAKKTASQPLFEAFQETSSPASPRASLEGGMAPAAPASPAAARYVFSEDDAPASPHTPSHPTSSGALHHPHSPTRSKSSTSVGTHHSIHTTGHTTIHTATTTTGQGGLHGAAKPSARSRTATGIPSPSKHHHGGKSVAGTVGGVTLVTSTTASMTAPSHAPSGASAQPTAAGSPQSVRASPGEAGGRYFGMNFLPASEEVRGAGTTQSPKSTTPGELAQATEPQTPSDEGTAEPQQQEEEPQWTAEWNRIEASHGAANAFDDSKARGDPPQGHNPITPGAEQLLDVTRDRAASEVSEDIEVDAPPSMPVLAPARTMSEVKAVKVSVVTGTEASKLENNSNNSSVAQPKGKPARFGKGSMAKRPGKKKSSAASRERGSSQDNTTRTSAPPERKEARPANQADVTGARPKAPGAAAPERGIQKTQAPSAVTHKQRRAHSANRKKKDGTDATKKADASQPHLYAEIHVPVKAPPTKGPALNERTPSTQSADPSLAMTSVSSLTGRESLFASAPAGGGFDDAANALAGAWCCEQPHDQIPAVGPEKVDGEGYKTEDYFDYGGEYVIKKGGNGVEAVDGDEGVLASVINVFGQVFCSACRCFDFGGGGVEEVDGANATGATTGMGNKSVMSGGIDVGATIIGTVHDTTATIANFSRALSQGGSKKTVPTFSEPVAKI